MIEDVVLFLEGKALDVRARLRERMLTASRQLDFERAAKLRDALQWLDQLEQPQAVELVGGGDADAIGFARDGDDACGVILRVRGGRLVAREHRFLENVEHETEGSVLAAFLVRFYLPLEQRAARVLLPFPPEDLDSLRELAADGGWLVPQRGTNVKLAALADQNARHLLDSLKIESFDIDERAGDPVFALGRDLGLASVPRALVCVDISTNQGRDTVGSLVWFEAGRPKKAEYRRFKIAGAPQDDVAAVREVVTRYLARRRGEDKPLPDLIGIDGGKGQLGAALEAARALGLETLPIVSLAKREEGVFLPGQAEPLRRSRPTPSPKLPAPASPACVSAAGSRTLSATGRHQARTRRHGCASGAGPCGAIGSGCRSRTAKRPCPSVRAARRSWRCADSARSMACRSWPSRKKGPTPRAPSRRAASRRRSRALCGAGPGASSCRPPAMQGSPSRPMPRAPVRARGCTPPQARPRRSSLRSAPSAPSSWPWTVTSVTAARRRAPTRPSRAPWMCRPCASPTASRARRPSVLSWRSKAAGRCPPRSSIRPGVGRG